ncbi:MAG: peptidoglycan-binding protein [Archangium sp.]|nr:peptidoglycan-binding protein [Archangium sp.]MDP3572952.1 peptidoglycan-binding protein [Archangium sp.]
MTSTLTVGTRSSAVTQLQQQLSKLGHYKAKVDGSYGPVTKKAVSSFEKQHNLKADGIADGKTRDALAAAATTPAAPVKQGMSGAKVKTLQTQLQRLGFYKAPVDGSFGPVTKAAVQAYERKNGWKPDGIAGARVQASLAKDVKALPKADWKTVAAPPADYRIVNFRGVKVNVRTRVMIERAESYMKQMGINTKLSISQGSYNTSVSASAGTHDGGGALDIRTTGYSSATADNVVKALRMAGFAGWRRGVNDSFSPHIHAIAIGDARATQVAKNQVAEYFRGGDGLVGSARDMHLTSTGHNIGRPVPNWAR